MTFTYAVIADSGIVLVADSQITSTHSDKHGVIGTYEGCRGKIKRIGARFAFSVAGDSGLADTLLAKANQNQVEKVDCFEAVVQSYQKAVLDEFQRLYPGGRSLSTPDVAFLFCGYNKKSSELQVVKLDSENSFSQNAITGRGMGAAGSWRHGAAYYLHHRFYSEKMPLEQAKLLAYCVAREVADQDNSVGGPIEMEIITLEGSRPLTNAEKNKYEKARQEIITKIRSFFAEFS